jgi:hypothetical protein
MTSFTHLWAKTSAEGKVGWHPLILHLLDVSGVADVVLMREPNQKPNFKGGKHGCDALLLPDL